MNFSRISHLGKKSRYIYLDHRSIYWCWLDTNFVIKMDKITIQWLCTNKLAKITYPTKFNICETLVIKLNKTYRTDISLVLDEALL